MTTPIRSDYAWLRQDSLVVAPLLLGATLLSDADGQTTGGIIVEVEAYRGRQDPASHAFGPKSARNTPMYETGGTIYVYRSYGIHTCMNIVTGPPDDPQAVLLRAIEPTTGLDIMRSRRNTDSITKLTSGPGRLCQALGITLALTGTHLGASIQLHRPLVPVDSHTIGTGPRIGISKAVANDWRFYIRGSRFVSGRAT